ncbi:exodeoxyribonuclease V subunit gamma [soil metagenome]
MTLHLHRAPRTDQLADGLGELLATPLDDPFAEEVVVVPAKGVERWLTQRLSHQLGVGPRGTDGVCAGVRFLNPRSLVSLLLDRDRDDPWDPDRLVWPLLTTIDDSLGEPWCADLARHLGHGQTGEEQAMRRDRRYSVARRLAGLFSSYAVQRPQLITDWREGRLTDGAGGDLAGDLAWQARLWQLLVERVGVDPPDLRWATTVSRLESGGAGLDLPARLSLFGHTRLPATEVRLLQALATSRDVHLWLPHPSLALWSELTDLGGVIARDDDTSAALVRHPLLASLGRDTRELRRTLSIPARDETAPPSGAETAPSAGPSTLLGLLQHDLRANHAPTPQERSTRIHDPGDRSLQVHACHGSARQVDVLREVLVGLLADDASLQPRDILVMCPDIETFAPLISAGFGLADVVADADGGGHPAHRLRVRLADRALTSTNPLLAVAASLVELAGGRVAASDVLDLAAHPTCRLRFAFTDDDLDRITTWVGQAGIRWGLDGANRGRFEMSRFEHNTWRAGLDRILLGVAMSGDDHHHLGRGLPVDDVGSGDIDLVGRLAELLDRLTTCLNDLDSAEDVATWMRVLTAGVRGLTDVETDAAWQIAQLERELARAADSPDGSGGAAGVPLRLADVRALLATRLGGRPTRANFRTGTLTVCTMVPMRSVPHRVVCLVGLDDGLFPRTTYVDGDDVLARRPLTGERDARSEDRQLLLDALLAATDHVVITYTGADEQSGAARPPAVPLGEILDAADRTMAEPVRDAILVHHPLQRYDPKNLTADGLIQDGSHQPFSFDADALAGARASVGARVTPPRLLDAPLAERERGDVSLADLTAFFTHPVRSFLRQRLGVSTPLTPDQLSDAIPVELDNLEVWGVGDRLLRELLAGQDASAVMLAEQLRGTLPPGQLAQLALKGVVGEAQKLLDRTSELRVGSARAVDVDIDLGDGRRLSGTVTGLYGPKLVSVGYSRLKPKQRLTSWINLLALSAARPDESYTAHAVGREKAGPKRALAGPIDHRGVEWLRQLFELRDQGLREPLPLPLATGAAWAEGHVRELMGDDVSPVQLARRAWETDPHNNFGIEGEDADAYHRRAYGDSAPLEVLLDAGLARYAWQVWEPLLTIGEKVGPL